MTSLPTIFIFYLVLGDYFILGNLLYGIIILQRFIDTKNFPQKNINIYSKFRTVLFFLFNFSRYFLCRILADYFKNNNNAF